MPQSNSRNPASYLKELNEETMRRAWGEDTSPEDRRRIVSAALIFGEQSRSKLAEGIPDREEAGVRRFLMSLMNDVVREFARREGVSEDEAASFLGDVGTRDRVLEFDEVLEAYASGESDRTLDELLNEAVQSRQERAVWSRHFSSG